MASINWSNDYSVQNLFQGSYGPLTIILGPTIFINKCVFLVSSETKCSAFFLCTADVKWSNLYLVKSQQKRKKRWKVKKNVCLTLCHPPLAPLQRWTWMGPLDPEPPLVHPPTGDRQDKFRIVKTSNKNLSMIFHKTAFGVFCPPFM